MGDGFEITGTPEPKSGSKSGSEDGPSGSKSGSEEGPSGSKSGSEDGASGSKSGSEDGPSGSKSGSDSMDGPGGDEPSPGQMDQCLRMIYCSSDDTLYSYADEMTEGETDGVSAHVVVSAISMVVVTYLAM